jgi:hypothetical protein
VVVLVVVSGASEGEDLLLVVGLVVGEDLLELPVVAMEVVATSIKTSTPTILALMDSPAHRLHLL